MPKIYQHLTLEERELISIWKAEGKSLREIATELNRNPSSISRELKSNSPPIHKGYYLAHKAHERAMVRKSLAHQRERLKNTKIRHYVEEKLQLGWSPEQVSGRITIDHPGVPGVEISHEAIYQYIYEDAPQWIPYLPKSHKRRQNRGHSRKHRKSHIPNRVSIDKRPKYIEKRKQAGHWETDTVVSRKSKAILVVLTERKSRYTKITMLPQKRAKETRIIINRRLGHYPLHMRRTITYDNGSENTEHEKVNQTLGTRSYFCNAYHSWEKGTVENTIGLIRRFLPKKTDFALVEGAEIKLIENLLNNRPRKCLNFLKPLEVFKNECCT